MDTQNPAQPDDLDGERVQPDGPLSGEVKRGGNFTLDTSGYVEDVDPVTQEPVGLRWSDLDAFTQGYVEALFAGLRQQHAGGNPMLPILDRKPFWRIVGFSDLAPEALAMILADCAGLSEIYSDTEAGGALFRADRQRGSFLGLNPETRFPPLTVSLGEDGKVHLA